MTSGGFVLPFVTGIADIRCDDGPEADFRAGRETRHAAPLDEPAELCLTFGPFHLYPRRRLLFEADRPLYLGSRALDILIALLERPGELVSKQELTARIWPDIIVEDSNLKVQVAALRRALRDCRAGNRYICTVIGRGYCFVAPLGRSYHPVPTAARQGSPAPPMPATCGRELLHRLAAQISSQQFVTVVGAADIGQRAAAAAALMGGGPHSIQFVDLAELSDPLMLPNAIAAAIGRDVNACDPLGGVAEILADRKMLLVLDRCRHVIGAVAAFAVILLGRAPGIQILAISR